jgi:excisionase family DNA binding protein
MPRPENPRTTAAEYLTIAQAAAEYPPSARTVRAAVADRHLAHTRLGTRIYLRRCDIESWIDARRVEAVADSDLLRSARRPPKSAGA